MDLDCCFILITFIYGFTLVVVDLYYVPFPLHNPTFTKHLVNRSLALVIGMKPCSSLQLTTTESSLFVVLKLSITYIQFATFLVPFTMSCGSLHQPSFGLRLTHPPCPSKF